MNEYDLHIRELKLKISKLYDFKKEIYTLNIADTERYAAKIDTNKKIILLKKELSNLRDTHANQEEHYLNYYNASRDKKNYQEFFEKKFKDDSRHLKYAWGRFVYQILKNPFVKTYKLNEQNGKCSYCNININKEVYNLHHRTYNYLCMNDSYIDTQDGSDFPIIPDCKKCSIDDNSRFKDCMSKIDYLHQSCHNKVHGFS